MTSFVRYLAAAAAIGGLSAPLAAQSSYPYSNEQQYPQSYPQQAYPQQGYPQQGYPQAYPQQAYPSYNYQQQGYAQNPVGQIINQLLGNRYNVTDRTAVSQCASAALTQAAAQYGNNGYGSDRYRDGADRYGSGADRRSGFGYGHNNSLRVTAITDVRRRSDGLRVSGLLSSGGYGSQYGYRNGTYGGAGNVSFRCNVDYRGQVTNVRLGRNMADRRGY